MEGIYDLSRRKLAAAYRRRKKLYAWWARIIGLVGVAVIFGWGLEVKFFDLVAGWTTNTFLQMIIFLGAIVVGGWSLDTVWEYYTDYRLEREFDLSNQTSGEWLADQVKYLLLALVLVNFVGWAFLSLVGRYPGQWWIYFSIGGFGFYLLMAFLMPVVLLPMFYKLTPYPETPLRERLMRLFERAGVQVANIYEINFSEKTNTANAAVIGMGKTRKIILGDTLRERYTDAEIEGVMAHEIGHHAHMDIFKLLVINLVGMVFASFATALVWPEVVAWRGYDELTSVAGLPLVLLVFGLFFWVFSPLEMWLSRVMERLADAFSLRLIDNPRDFGTALAKLADDNLSLLKYDWYTLLFHASHPAIGERVERAINWKGK